jgi:hypothetical protein
MAEAVKTKKMKFSEDKFVDGELMYEKDKVHDIPEGSVDRWLKRGGELVEKAEEKASSKAPQTDSTIPSGEFGDDDFEEIDEVEEHTGKKTGKKKKVAKKKNR